MVEIIKEKIMVQEDGKNQISVEVYSKKTDKMGAEQFLQIVEKAGSLATEDLTKLIAEVPNFSEVVKTTFAGVRYTYDETIKRNDAVVSKVTDACHRKMDALDRMLEEDDLTAQEKLAVVKEMSSVIKTLEKVDAKNKRFIEESKINSNNIIFGTMGITATVILTAIAVLSGKKR